MPWTWRDYAVAGLTLVGGVHVVRTVGALLKARVHEDDVDFAQNQDGSWTVVDARTGAELGEVVEDDDGFGVTLDYAPGARALHLTVEREFGVEKNLDSARDVVVEYLRDNDLLAEG